MKGSEVDEVVRRMQAGALPVSVVRQLTRSSQPLVRANALIHLVPDARQDPLSLASISDAVTDAESRFRLRGLVTVSFVAMECLLRVATPAARLTFDSHLAGWPQPERENLIEYVKSQGLTV